MVNQERWVMFILPSKLFLECVFIYISKHVIKNLPYPANNLTVDWILFIQDKKILNNMKFILSNVFEKQVTIEWYLSYITIKDV